MVTYVFINIEAHLRLKINIYYKEETFCVGSSYCKNTRNKSDFVKIRKKKSLENSYFSNGFYFC